MLKRREFLHHSMVVATAASTGVLSASATAAPRSLERTAIHFVIFDEALEDSVAFARELSVRGARAFAVQQDLGRLWFGELGAAFGAGSSIAGLTSHSELLICADFARRHGARVQYEGAHDCRGGAVLTHSLRIDPSWQAMSPDLAAADVAWPRVLAARLANLSMSAATLCEDYRRTETRRTASNPGSLFSWVIA
jgi:hypothetical protein